MTDKTTTAAVGELADQADGVTPGGGWLSPDTAADMFDVLGPHLAEACDAAGISSDPVDVYSDPRGQALLAALNTAGLLKVPGRIQWSTPLHQPPTAAKERDQVFGEVTAAVEPILREQARRQHSSSSWPDDVPARSLVFDCTAAELVDAMWRAGLITLDVYRDDRAGLRKSWAAMTEALILLARHEDLPDSVLAAVPVSHVSYLMGQQEARKRLAAAWARIEACRRLLEVVRHFGRDDLGYMRANLAVLGGLLDGRAGWAPEPGDHAYVATSEQAYDIIRAAAANAALEAEKLHAETGARIAGGPHPSPRRAQLHLYTQRTARYAWALVALMGYVREAGGQAMAAAAADTVDEIIENGPDSPYLADLRTPAGSTR